LAALASQAPNRQPAGLAVFGQLPAEELAAVASAAGLPLVPLQPEPKLDIPFLAGFGLLEQWRRHGQLPVNFIQFKETKPPVNTTRQRALVYGCLGVFAVILLFIIGQRTLGMKQRNIQE